MAIKIKQPGIPVSDNRSNTALCVTRGGSLEYWGKTYRKFLSPTPLIGCALVIFIAARQACSRPIADGSTSAAVGIVLYLLSAPCGPNNKSNNRQLTPIPLKRALWLENATSTIPAIKSPSNPERDRVPITTTALPTAMPRKSQRTHHRGSSWANQTKMGMPIFKARAYSFCSDIIPPGPFMELANPVVTASYPPLAPRNPSEIAKTYRIERMRFSEFARAHVRKAMMNIRLYSQSFGNAILGICAVNDVSANQTQSNTSKRMPSIRGGDFPISQ